MYLIPLPVAFAIWKGWQVFHATARLSGLTMFLNNYSKIVLKLKI
jgi:hypothetical protein